MSPVLCALFDRDLLFVFFFFFNDTATTEIYTLSLHDALPISIMESDVAAEPYDQCALDGPGEALGKIRDRKSTRLNSSHSQISYAVFCLKKKKKIAYDRIYRIITPT